MTKYLLNTERMRLVTRNERGNVNWRKSYSRGDEVDTSKMDEARVKHLVEKGTLVSSEGNLSEPESAGATSPTSPPFGASTAGPEDTSGAEPDEDDGSESVVDDPDVFTAPHEPGEDVTPEGGGDEPEDVDRYSEMDYATLQQEAKTRTGNGSGSAEDLRARLRAADASV